MAKTSSKTSRTIEMNEELKQWLTEQDKQQLEKTISHHMKHKQPKGMCQICGTTTAKAVCLKCNRFVCSSCYYHLVGLCQKCLSKETVETWKQQKPDWEKLLGVDWVD